ncbi:MAG TPA: hypothetical protein VNW29_01565 [Candidatus Sulfotelmatobacter sp.]|jgi:hypothetical protein|nr:hypothetical protein [Candidatus Sulfotelmatobacter sp.]
MTKDEYEDRVTELVALLQSNNCKNPISSAPFADDMARNYVRQFISNTYKGFFGFGGF